MPDNQKHIKPTADLIRRYLAGELDDKTMHALEKQALDDPFLADALEGYGMHEPDQSAAIADLQARLNERVNSGRKTAVPAAEAAGPETAVEPAKGKVRRLDYRWAAAAVILVILSVGGVLLLNRTPGGQDIAQVPKTKDTVVLTKPDVNTADVADTLPGLTAVQENSKPRTETPSAEDQARQKAQQQALSAQGKEQAQTLAKTKDAKKTQSARTAPPPPPAARAAETSAYAAAPAPLLVKEETHAKNFIIDTILIGSSKKDTGSDLAVRKALAQGNKVEGVVTGAESKYRRYSEENDLRLLSGQVIDAMNGQKLPGVTIQVRGTDKAVVTDTAGYFALKVEPNKRLDLDFSYVGYERTNVAVAGNQNHLNVSLPQNSQALNSVVVAGYGTVRKKKNAPAAPYYGDSAYKKYLESIKTVPVKGLKEKLSGEVSVSFTVMPDGTLKNIKAHQPFHEEAGKAAVENIKGGPQWFPASNGKKSTVHLQVPVELVPAE